MNSFVSFFSSPAAEVMTRTLLHSFWQSAGLLIILLFILRITPERHSKARYFFAYASMMILLATGGYTFIDGWHKSAEFDGTVKLEIVRDAPFVAQEIAAPSATLLEQMNALIAAYTPYIVMLWTLGVCFFLFRLSGSWWYLYMLRKNVRIHSGELADQLDKLAARLNIRKTVLLAESASVHVPLVIGCLKPMLLIPVGFVSGLSTQQVEAIFIHELTHIKREDYLFNLIQSIAEAIFFFNPFVWIISSIIRREREHCCDDAVLRSGGNAIAYIRALAHLEEHRGVQPTLALSAIGTKNELLNRIKRIMEKSAVKNSFREKLIPATLLVIGIVCASWVTITTKDKAHFDKPSNLVESDTTIKKKNSRSATYSRSRVVTTAPDGTPHEEVTENFTGDEEFRGIFPPELADNFVMPPIPEMPGFDMILPPHFQGFAFYSDSLPRKGVPNSEQWKEFQQQFQTRLKEQFGDFYLKNQKEINKMLDETPPDFSARFDEDFALQFENMTALRDNQMILQEEHLKMNEEFLKDHEENMREMEAQMQNWEQEHAEELKKIEEEMKGVEQKMKAFENELEVNLRKDGYLKDNESLRQMRWNDNGDIEINDIKVKAEDAKKYREIHSRYFDHEPQGFRFEN